jgi:hypothetical protein
MWRSFLRGIRDPHEPDHSDRLFSEEVHSDGLGPF